MTEYKKIIKSRVILLALSFVVSTAIVYLGVVFAEKSETVASTYFDGFSRGFPIGLFSGFLAIMLFLIIRYIRALRNESMLKKLHIEENDERKKAIRQSALGKSFFFTTGILVVGLTVTSFYNTIISITLAVVLSVHVLAGVAFKIYYLMKY